MAEPMSRLAFDAGAFAEGYASVKSATLDEMASAGGKWRVQNLSQTSSEFSPQFTSPYSPQKIGQQLSLSAGKSGSG